jgi:serine/threonine protein kinase
MNPSDNQDASQAQFEVLGSVFTVDKRYSPLKALGKGAYGVVCAAKDKATGEKVALKKVSPAAATRSDGLHTLREVRLCRWLGKHPQIIGLNDISCNFQGGKDEVYLSMPLFDTDLHRIIQSAQPLGDAHYKHFMYQLLRGLRFAHVYNIVHRDLKPANLLVTKACDLVISDFGLARLMPEDKGPMTEHVVTRWYRAPELMLSADGTYTQSVDLWSCGCILAELLGRQPLFNGKDFMEVCSMQINVLGTRPEEELAYIRSDQALQFLHALPPKQKVNWSSLYPEASPKVLDLLDKLLQFHPSKRPTAEEAMGHPYFDSVRSQYSDPEPVLPVGPGGFEFSFENDPTLQPDDFKRLLVEEASSFKAERAWAKATAGSAYHAAGPGSGALGASGVTTAVPSGMAGGSGPATMVGGSGAATMVGGGIGGDGGSASNAMMAVDDARHQPQQQSMPLPQYNSHQPQQYHYQHAAGGGAGLPGVGGGMAVATAGALPPVGTQPGLKTIR